MSIYHALRFVSVGVAIPAIASAQPSPVLPALVSEAQSRLSLTGGTVTKVWLVEPNDVVVTFRITKSIAELSSTLVEVSRSACTTSLSRGMLDSGATLRFRLLFAEGERALTLTKLDCDAAGQSAPVSNANGQYTSFAGGLWPAVIHAQGKSPPFSVASCEDWLDRLETIPSNHKFVEFMSPPKLGPKSEYETVDAYAARLATFSATDRTIWVNLVFKVDPKMLSYNADTEELRIAYDGDKAGIETEWKEGTPRQGTTAFGVSGLIRPLNIRTTSARFSPSERVLPRDQSLTLPAEGARLLKESGKIHVLGKLVGTTGSGSFSPATLSNPTALAMGTRTISVEPVCSAVSFGARVLVDWDHFL